MKQIERVPSLKIALLGGEDWNDQHGRQFTKYTALGHTVLLSYDPMTLAECTALEAETGATVIAGRWWGWNMTEKWKALRANIVWQLSETTIFIVRFHYPIAYRRVAKIKPVRLNNSGIWQKNLGMPFRTIGEAVAFCHRNNIKILE